MGMVRQSHSPAALYPGKRQPLYRGRVGPRGVLDECVKSRLHRDRIPGPPSPWRVAVQTKLFWPTQLWFHSVCYYRLSVSDSGRFVPLIFEMRLVLIVCECGGSFRIDRDPGLLSLARAVVGCCIDK